MGNSVERLSCVEDVEDLCNARKTSPRDKMATAEQVSVSKFELGDDTAPYGIGLLFMMRNDKLIVAGYGSGSDGQRAGVRTGDILAVVDGNMVLDLKSVNGKHPAQDMMVGTKNTTCEIKLLRVQESEEVKLRRASLNSGTPTPPSSNDVMDEVKLKEVTCVVKRLVPLASAVSSPPLSPGL